MLSLTGKLHILYLNLDYLKPFHILPSPSWIAPPLHLVFCEYCCFLFLFWQSCYEVWDQIHGFQMAATDKCIYRLTLSSCHFQDIPGRLGLRQWFCAVCEFYSDLSNFVFTNWICGDQAGIIICKQKSYLKPNHNWHFNFVTELTFVHLRTPLLSFICKVFTKMVNIHFVFHSIFLIYQNLWNLWSFLHLGNWKKHTEFEA